MKNNLSNVLLPLATLSLASCAGQQKEEPKRPNIIFMMTDDHTTQAMSCYGGNLLQTPNMDRIANWVSTVKEPLYSTEILSFSAFLVVIKITPWEARLPRS
jgi:hypothetical protein